MATGSSGPAGVCAATRSVPPCLNAPAGAGSVAGVVAPGVVSPGVVGPVVPFGAALSSEPQAAMMLPMNATPSPRTEPRVTKVRREIAPAA